MANEKKIYEEVLIEEKPTLGERAMDFMADHPAIGWTLYAVACVTVAVPLCAIYGCFVGKKAGKSAARELIAAGVKLR